MSIDRLQRMMTWAEDRALLGSNSSADPGARSEGRAVSQTGAAPPFPFVYGTMRKIPGGLGDWSPSYNNTAFSPFTLANNNRPKFQFTVNQDTAVQRFFSSG